MRPDSLIARRILAWTGAGALAVGGAFILASQLRGDQSAGTTAAGTQGFAVQSAGPAAAGTRWLEFDLEADAASITGFVVGYFPPKQKKPAFSFEVPRSEVQAARSGSLRLPLIVGNLPPGQTFEIRLRTVAGGRRSPWSEPSGVFTVPGDPSAAPASAAARKEPDSRRRSRPGKSAVTELERDASLRARMAAEFPEVDLAKAATGYRSVRDLAADLFAARNLKIPFADIKKLTAEAGNRNLRNAIARLNPRLDARAEARRAVNQSREALEPTSRR